MKDSWWKIAVVIALVVAVAVVVASKNRDRERDDRPAVTDKAPAVESNGSKLPRLVDLGSKTCIPCKMMKPILAELTTEYKGKLVVEFIDVYESKEKADKYGISSIPTQVFYDSTGKELSRHIGFIPKKDILATFSKYGVKL